MATASVFAQRRWAFSAAQDGVVDGLLAFRALAEVVGEELDYLVEPIGLAVPSPRPTAAWYARRRRSRRLE